MEEAQQLGPGSSSMAGQTVDRETVLNMAVRSQMQKSQQRSRVVPLMPSMPTDEPLASPVTEMRRLSGRGDGILSIAALDPDLNKDGRVEPWEKEVYQRLLDADMDGSGTVSVKELFGVMRQTGDELREARKGAIPIAHLDPDADGDGKVEPWESEIFLRIQDADEDKSGSISVKEVPPLRNAPRACASSQTRLLALTRFSRVVHAQLFAVIRKAAESDRQKRLFRKLFFAASAMLVVMLLANTGLTAAIVFLAKDTTLSADGALTTSAGDVVRVHCIN